MKYILGTAQFGLNYGVSNTSGKIQHDDIQKILKYATDAGVQYLDTANIYGESETKIGTFSELSDNFNIITKTATFKEKVRTNKKVKLIEDEFLKSLTKLGRQNVYALLIHDPRLILSEDGAEVFNALNKLKNLGLVEKIGVSVYTFDELEEILSLYSIDIVQFPLNVFNQSFGKSKYLKELKKKGIELHARSIFLQGLLLMSSDKLNFYFNPIKKKYTEYEKMLSNEKITKLQGALNYIKQFNELDGIVFGVQNHTELKEIIEALNLKTISLPFKDFAIEDESFNNPSNWKLK